MATPDDSLPLAISLREVVAMQVLIASGERLDPEALAALNQKLETQLEQFRHRLGTVRFGAVLKNAWRRSDAAEPDQ